MDGHLIDVAALAATPYGLAANCLHAGGVQTFVHARVPIGADQTKNALRHDAIAASEPRLQLLDNLAGRTSPKRHNTPAFPQVGEVDSERHPPKTAQKSKTYGEVGAHFLRNDPEVAETRPRAKARQPSAPTRAQPAASQRTHLRKRKTPCAL